VVGGQGKKSDTLSETKQNKTKNPTKNPNAKEA
jgi:hypothetical protein